MDILSRFVELAHVLFKCFKIFMYSTLTKKDSYSILSAIFKVSLINIIPEKNPIRVFIHLILSVLQYLVHLAYAVYLVYSADLVYLAYLVHWAYLLFGLFGLCGLFGLFGPIWSIWPSWSIRLIWSI